MRRRAWIWKWENDRSYGLLMRIFFYRKRILIISRFSLCKLYQTVTCFYRSDQLVINFCWDKSMSFVMSLWIMLSLQHRMLWKVVLLTPFKARTRPLEGLFALNRDNSWLDHHPGHNHVKLLWKKNSLPGLLLGFWGGSAEWGRYGKTTNVTALRWVLVGVNS